MLPISTPAFRRLSERTPFLILAAINTSLEMQSITKWVTKQRREKRGRELPDMQDGHLVPDRLRVGASLGHISPASHPHIGR